MYTVIDANVAAKVVLPEENAIQARALIRDVLHRGERLFAPSILYSETGSLLRNWMRRERLAFSGVTDALNVILSLPIVTVDAPALHRDAFRLAQAMSMSIYDALYAALSQALRCDFWTDDMKLLSAIAGRLPFVCWIGDYGSTAP